MKIRKYQPNDKQYLREICKKTAGDFFTKNKSRLEGCAIIYNDYFTEQEPENIFVLADEANIPKGYIICAENYDKFKHLMMTEYFKKIFKVSFVLATALFGYLIRLSELKGKEVHLHIDILPEYQGQGYGTLLINTLCKKLKEDGILFVSVCSISKKSIGYKFYKKLGFYEIHNHLGNMISLTKKI